MFTILCACVFFCADDGLVMKKTPSRALEKVFTQPRENGTSRNYTHLRELGIALEYWLNIFPLLKNILRYRIAFKF